MEVKKMKKEIKIFPKAENNEDKKAIQNCLEKKGIWNCRNCTILNCELVEGQLSMVKCRFDGTEMEENIKEYTKFKIKEFRCLKCGHYYFRKIDEG